MAACEEASPGTGSDAALRSPVTPVSTEGDVAPSECSAFPLTDHDAAVALALQQASLEKQGAPVSREQKQLRALDAVCRPMSCQNVSKAASAPNMQGMSFGPQHADRLAMQNCCIMLLKMDQQGDTELQDRTGGKK